MRKPRGGPNTILGPDVRDFLYELHAHGVAFVLVGGYALAAYGVVRATSDIDFFFRRTMDNVERLCSALQAFGAPPNVIDPVHLLAPDTTIQFGVPPERIDLLGTLDGVDFEAVYAEAIELQIDRIPLRVISLADLRTNKAATGRPRDLSDLELLPLPDPPPATP